MPFGPYSSMSDCISKNQNASNPGAYCASIHKQITGKWPTEEAYRHPDFNKIYKQFLTVEDGENRYFKWLTDLNLDETRRYADSRKEQFRWLKRHVDFKLWKEDSEAKYWRVEAGFPLESMNNNIYNKDDLLRSARTIKGGTVNLNHSIPLKTVEILAGEYEDDVVECVLRVPKATPCPVNSEKRLNDFIEKGGIVNVSLEASCTYDSPPEQCEGMYFSGLALLTKDTLPGIPLTRLMPLEKIMVEALQAETTTKRNMENVQRIEMKVVNEEDEPEPTQEEPCPEGEHRDENGKCVADSAEEQVVTTDITDDTGPGQRNIAPKAVAPDEHGQCPEGYILNTALNQCVIDTSCPEGQHFDDALQKCMPDTVPKPETPATAVGVAAAPAEKHEDVLDDTLPTADANAGPLSPPPLTAMPPEAGAGDTGKPNKLPAEKPPEEETPKPPHDCPDGYTYDIDANQCVPTTLLTEKIARMKAEDKVKYFERHMLVWEQRYKTVSTKYSESLGESIALKKQITELRDDAARLNEKRIKLDTDLREEQKETDSLHRQLRDLTKQYEAVKGTKEELDKKYHATLNQNLDLSRKLTNTNEEYLAISKERDKLLEDVKKAKRHAKKVMRIKV